MTYASEQLHTGLPALSLRDTRKEEIEAIFKRLQCTDSQLKKIILQAGLELDQFNEMLEEYKKALLAEVDCLPIKYAHPLLAARALEQLWNVRSTDQFATALTEFGEVSQDSKFYPKTKQVALSVVTIIGISTGILAGIGAVGVFLAGMIYGMVLGFPVEMAFVMGLGMVLGGAVAVSLALSLVVGSFMGVMALVEKFETPPTSDDLLVGHPVEIIRVSKDKAQNIHFFFSGNNLAHQLSSSSSAFTTTEDKNSERQIEPVATDKIQAISEVDSDEDPFGFSCLEPSESNGLC